MIDYSLYGMNFIHYSSVKFRRKVTLQNNCQSEEDKPLSQASNISLDGYINPDEIEISMLGPPQLAKLTRCELEVDVLACDILDTKPSGTYCCPKTGLFLLCYGVGDWACLMFNLFAQARQFQ